MSILIQSYKLNVPNPNETTAQQFTDFQNALNTAAASPGPGLLATVTIAPGLYDFLGHTLIMPPNIILSSTSNGPSSIGATIQLLSITFSAAGTYVFQHIALQLYNSATALPLGTTFISMYVSSVSSLSVAYPLLGDVFTSGTSNSNLHLTLDDTNFQGGVNVGSTLLSIQMRNRAFLGYASSTNWLGFTGTDSTIGPSGFSMPSGLTGSCFMRNCQMNGPIGFPTTPMTGTFISAFGNCGFSGFGFITSDFQNMSSIGAGYYPYYSENLFAISQSVFSFIEYATFVGPTGVNGITGGGRTSLVLLT